MRVTEHVQAKRAIRENLPWNRCAAAGVRLEGVSARRATPIASATVVATAIGVLLAASASAETATHRTERLRGVVESCATQSGAKFPGAFTNPRNLIVGPLSLVGAGGRPQFVWDSTGKEGFQKFPLLVRENHRVTVELSERTRRGGRARLRSPSPGGGASSRHASCRDFHRV